MPQDNSQLLAEIERLKKELKAKRRYGLVWEDKKEDVVEQCKEKLPVLKEDKSKEIITDPNKPVNILIEGDNYHALSVLNYTHQGKIDVIYIDPPYNTGNKDFKYNDKFVDKDDGFRHSKWISFVEKRIELSKNLLKDSGVIFLSIGDDELAQLKLLLDSPELFTERNFIACIPRVAKTASNKGRHFAPSVDYILAYAKNIDKLEPFKDEVDSSLYKKNDDEKGFYRDDVALYQSGLIGKRPNCRYFINCPDGSKVIPPEGKFWRWGPETAEKNKDIMVFKQTKTSPLLDENGKQARWNIYTKSYLSEREESGTVPRNYLDQFINRHGADYLKTMGIAFDYSKPVELIKYLIKITNKGQETTVLDFMAGSGTTAQAVLEINKEDGGNRNFILCTNNENNICSEICYPRIKNVINGFMSTQGIGGNLKYFKTEFVDAEPTDSNKVKLTTEAVEMLCIKERTFEEVVGNIFYKIFRSNDHYTGIIFDSESIPVFKKSIKNIDGNFSVYIFSLGDETFDEEFADISKKVRLSPIPEAILKVYRRIFK